MKNKDNILFLHTFSPLLLLGPELQSADRDSKGAGEQQEHAGAESEPQRHRLHPQPAVHQPDRPAVSGPERQQAGQPAAADETPGSPADTHPQQQPTDACSVTVRRSDICFQECFLTPSPQMQIFRGLVSDLNLDGALTVIFWVSLCEQPAASYGGFTDSSPEEHPEDPEQHAYKPGGTDTISR